jgi:outer membrane protein TolC
VCWALIKLSAVLGILWVTSAGLYAQEKRSLDYYLNAGLANSPMLLDSSNQYKANLLDSLRVLAGFGPQVTSTGQIMRAPVVGKFGYDSAITNGANYSGVVAVEQPLFNGRPRRAQFQNITLLNQALRLNVQLSEIDLKKSITAQYITAYSDYSQLEFNQNLLKILQNEQPALKKLVENGVYLQTDYLNLTVSIHTQLIALKKAALQYRDDLYALNLLCGVYDRAEVILLKPELPIRTAFLVNSSPQMLRFRVDSLKLVTARQLLDLNYRPRLSAFADGGVNAINPRNIPRNLGASFGLNFTAVLYDGRQRRLQHSRLQLQEITRQKYRDYYLSQYHTQVSQLLERLHATDELLTEIRAQIAAQQRLLTMYKVEIANGLVRFTDFILNVTNYTTTRNDLVQAENDRLQLLNELNYLK